jgi:hypothetical protein
MLQDPRETEFSGILKETGETYSIKQSAYIDFFEYDYDKCSYCEITSYLVADIEGDHAIPINSGTISTVMPSQDLSTSFNLDP